MAKRGRKPRTSLQFGRGAARSNQDRAQSARCEASPTQAHYFKIDNNRCGTCAYCGLVRQFPADPYRTWPVQAPPDELG